MHGWLDPTLTASILRENVIPPILAVIGFLFPSDVRATFAQALLFLR